jgi:hypothetical protein
MTSGNIAFLGSGETSLAGGRIFEQLARQLSMPLRIAVLETPAGFELNSAQVAGKVADFLKTRLGNYKPQVDVIPARKKSTGFSPDDPEICAPLLHANFIFMGPGSPTYAIRQLQGSLAWDIIRARHRLGATLVFASAATIAAGAFGLPVYEIYKVGMDVHVIPGLDLFADYDTPLSILPHWNNTDGGADMDTSRCFIGMDRFSDWCTQLPAGQTVLGLDEHTGIILNFSNRQCQVVGVSSVSLVRECDPQIFPSGSDFPLSQLGPLIEPASPSDGIPADVWSLVSHANSPITLQTLNPPDQVLALVEDRQAARARKDWAASDEIRRQITDLGWTVQDVAQGWKLIKN